MRGLYILLVTFMVGFCLGCWPKENCVQKYGFHIPTEITSEPDTIAIGDTVWFYSHYPTQLKNQINGELVDLTKFSFAPKIFFTRIDSAVQISALPYASFKSIHGQFYPVDTGFDCVEKMESGEKRLKIGMICRSKGIYFMRIAQGFSDADITVTNEKCYESVNSFFVMNENRENNYYLLKSSPISYIRDIDIKEFQAWGSYAFVVN